MSSVAVGIIGAGWVARNRHIPAFRHDPRVRILAIADRSAQRARDVARICGIPYHTADPSDLFSRVEAVSICTPPWTHADLSIRALRSGCHVLVEKPMAATVQESREMIEASAATQRFLCVAHNFLFSRSARRALALVAGDAIGTPRTLFAFQLSSWRRRIPQWFDRLPGGLFFDEAPHMLYLIKAFVGGLDVRTAHLTLDPGGRISRAQASLWGAQGEAQVEMIAGTSISEWILTVVGSRGLLVLDLFRDIVVHLGSDGDHRPRNVLATSLRAVAQHLGGVLTSGSLLATRRLNYGHNLLISRFLDAVLGLGPLPVTPQDGAAVVQSLHEILAQADARESLARRPVLPT